MREPPLGAIGAELAGSLIDAGYQLAVYDTRPDAVAAFADRGARPCASCTLPTSK